MITRFAPSPTGPLHLGHAFSALLAHDLARAAGGLFYLRIEDIDQTRSRRHWEDQILDDLQWLGIRFDGDVMRQSDRLLVYQDVLKKLWADNLIYPCVCKRRDILEAMSAPQEGVEMTGPDGLIYPGTCRPRGTEGSRTTDEMPQDSALRINWRATDPLTELSYIECRDGLTVQHDFHQQSLIEDVGDVVLARLDMGTSYHLSVVIDDAAQGITDVVRGADLEGATKIHVALQRLLGLPTPRYHHHRLIRDDAGKRLAKRDDARAITKFRDDGLTPNDIRDLVGLPKV